MLLHLATDGGSVNPDTGLLEFWDAADDSNDNDRGGSFADAFGSGGTTTLGGGDDDDEDRGRASLLATDTKAAALMGGHNLSTDRDYQDAMDRGAEGGTESRASLRADDPKAARLMGGDDLSTDKAYRAAMDDARQDRARAAAQSAKNRERKQKEEQLKEAKAYQATYREAVKRQQAEVEAAREALGKARVALGDTAALDAVKSLGGAVLGFATRGLSGKLGKGREAVKNSSKAVGDALSSDAAIRALHEDVQEALDALNSAKQTEDALAHELSKYDAEIQRLNSEIQNLQK